MNLVDIRTLTEVYPKINIEEDGSGVLEIRTNLRKEQDGVWYEWFIREKYNLSPTAPIHEQREKYLNRFHAYVYRVNILGMIGEDVGESSYLRQSKDKRSERERLTV